MRNAGLALLAAMAIPLSACGLQPMYAGAGSAAVNEGLAAVEVPAIPGQAGWLVRNAINDKLSASGNQSTRYRLDIRLDDSLQGLGVLGDDTISRERRTLRARYQLVDITDDTILLDATAGADAGIDVVSSEYATIAAEQRALENLSTEIADRIVTRIALTLRSRDADAAPPAQP
ncbi:MAG: LPS assembly lipoprotein LptE [Erythrobacter sp.]